MPHSFSTIVLHIVFATKFRLPILGDDIREELHAYIAGIVANVGGVLLSAGSVQDHIHLLSSLPRTCTPAKLIQDIKSNSSRWIKSTSSSYSGFCWQNGYSAFSVDVDSQPRVTRYIKNQRERHRTITFEEEYRKILAAHNIVFDEKWGWD